MKTIYREYLEAIKSDPKLKDHFVIRCYNLFKMYKEKDRQKVMDKFEEGIICSEGSERERYENIRYWLKSGIKVIFDDDKDLQKMVHWMDHNQEERKRIENQVNGV